MVNIKNKNNENGNLINHKTYKIFLASSSELEKDRNDFEILINRENSKFIEKGIFLKLIRWEDFLDYMDQEGLQSRYNEAVKDCDIFVMLFFSKVGKFTEKEFEIAFGNFKEFNTPKIYTYFKNAEIKIGSLSIHDFNSLDSFKNKLKELNHYITEYKNIEDLKYQFSNQLDKLFKIIQNEKSDSKSDIDNYYDSLIQIRSYQKCFTTEIIKVLEEEWYEIKQLNILMKQERVIQHLIKKSVPDNIPIVEKLKSLPYFKKGFLIKGVFLCLAKENFISNVSNSAESSHFFVFEDNAGLSTKINEIVDGNLITQYYKMIDHIKGILYLNRDINTRTEEYEIPQKVFTELVANAFIHRDYSNDESTTSIYLYPNRLEIVNPGKFPKGVKLDELDKLFNSHAKNKQIALVFYSYGIVERAGKGINRSQSILKSNGFEPAIFEQRVNQVIVTIFKKKNTNEIISENKKFESQEKPINIIPIYNIENFIGRKEILNNLHSMLTSQNSAILINGIGGIGKTTLALAYCNTEKYQKEYQNIVWVTINQNMKDSIINTFIDKDIDFKYNEDEDTDKNYIHVLNTLRNIQGNNLLVIDNANNDREIIENKQYLEDTHWKILLTTRCSMPQFNEISIAELSHDDAVNLFLRYYHKDDREMLDELIKQINNHTLLTELLAKAANENPELNIRVVFALIKNWEINNDILQSEIFTQHQLNNEKKQELIKVGNYLYAIFGIAELNEDEKLYLMYFSILPSVSINYFDLKNYFAIADDKSTTFNNILKSLKRKGWLIEIGKYSYKIHPLIQTVIREKLQPNAENCQIIIKSFTELLSYKPHESPISRKELVPFAESILNFIIIDNIYTADLINKLTIILNALGKYDKALEYTIQLISTREKLLELDKPFLANTYSNIALTYSSLGNFKKALEFQNKSIMIIEKVLVPDHPDLASSYNNLSLTYISLANFEKALEYQNKSLAIREKVLDANHPDIATSYDNYALIYRNIGNYKKSLEYLIKSIVIREKVLETNHPDLASSYNNIAFTYNDLGEYKKALEYQLKSITIREKVLEANHPDLATSYNNISGVYRNLGNYKKAMEYILKAIEIREKILNNNHPDLATAYNYLALLFNDLKDYSKALEFNLKCIEIYEKALEKNHPWLAISYNNISITYYYLKDYANAKYYIDKAVEIYKKAFPENHPHLEGSLEWQITINKAIAIENRNDKIDEIL